MDRAGDARNSSAPRHPEVPSAASLEGCSEQMAARGRTSFEGRLRAGHLRMTFVLYRKRMTGSDIASRGRTAAAPLGHLPLGMGLGPLGDDGLRAHHALRRQRHLLDAQGHRLFPAHARRGDQADRQDKLHGSILQCGTNDLERFLLRHRRLQQVACQIQTRDRAIHNMLRCGNKARLLLAATVARKTGFRGEMRRSIRRTMPRIMPSGRRSMGPSHGRC